MAIDYLEWRQEDFGQVFGVSQTVISQRFILTQTIRNHVHDVSLYTGIYGKQLNQVTINYFVTSSNDQPWENGKSPICILVFLLDTLYLKL